MLEAYLREAKIRSVRVVTLLDGPSVSWAIGNLIRKCRPDALFLSTERSTLADRARRRVRVVRFRRTGEVSSTRIRDAIAAGRDDWKRLTGRSVARWIVRLDGERRIRAAYEGAGRRGPGRRIRRPDAPAHRGWRSPKPRIGRGRKRFRSV